MLNSYVSLNKTVVEDCKKAGIILAYHNHTEEFENVEGETLNNIFFSQLTRNIKMELDNCWATKTGIDPVVLFKKHPVHFPLWHVNDLDKEMQKTWYHTFASVSFHQNPDEIIF